MLQLNFIRENKERIIEGLRTRNYKESDFSIVDDVIGLDDKRKTLQFDLDSKRNELKTKSAEIGQLFKQGKSAEADSMKISVALLKDEMKSLDSDFAETQAKLNELLLSIPNVPHPTVPPGKSDEDNEVVVDWEAGMPKLHENAIPHWELVKKYNIIDFEMGVKITGAGFPVYRGKGAILQRALINFFLAEANKAGFEEIMPPIMVNEDTARATGQLPDKEGQMYHVGRDNLYLIPTAEVPVTNIYRNVIVDADKFPFKMTGYTPCFRREAGSYGADVKGLNRLHQFDKVEIVVIEHPDRSYQRLEKMKDHVKGLLEKLELPYRILRLCGGDLGFTSCLTFDFEVFSAAQEKWLEVSSVSNFENFQSNRLKVRFKEENGKTRLAHTLNGSALALPRIVAALLENNQTEDGIIIPMALRPFTGFDIIN